MEATKNQKKSGANKVGLIWVLCLFLSVKYMVDESFGINGGCKKGLAPVIVPAINSHTFNASGDRVLYGSRSQYHPPERTPLLIGKASRLSSYIDEVRQL